MTDAWELAGRFAPPENWDGHDQAVLAGRLLANWGDQGASNRIHFLNFRRHPGSGRALLYAGYTKAQRHGPLETLRWLDRMMPGVVSDNTPRDRAHLLALKADQLAEFRDFDAASALLAQAAQISPDDPWLHCEQASLHRKADRYDEAVASARRALEIRPWYRPAIGVLSSLLQLRGGEEEALALLTEASARLQSGHIRISRFNLLQELGRFREAEEAVCNLEGLLPRMPAGMRRWLAGVRADLAYQQGRTADAVAHAANAEGPFFSRMAERLSDTAASGRRIVLPVPFVRQHHMTCAPATLTALARFFGVEIDHLALAARIAYDGTPDHEERHWAESNGWFVREFRVTWDSARALIEQGIPFTFTTVSTRNAHLQAVIGCDSRLGTLVFRDPYQRTQGEALAEDLLVQQAASGPRGMVMIPAGQAQKLDGLDLPDAELYDQWYHISRSLWNHDHVSARAAASTLAALAPDHRLNLWARRQLAAYEGSLAGQLSATRELRKLYPSDANALLAEISLLRQLGRMEELRELLNKEVGRRNADTLVRLEHVSLLAEQSPRATRTLHYAWRLLHWRATDASALRTCANILWDRRDLVLSTQLYRLAALVAGTNENHWRSFFIASRHLGEAESALAILRQRFESTKARAPWPACTLFSALDMLERTPEGFAVLDEALALQPDDSSLALFAARQHANYGNTGRAHELLAPREGRSRPTDWHRAAAAIARAQIDHRAALEHWRAILTAEPLDEEALGEVARLLEICEGRDAALAHLRAALAAHPYYIPIHTMVVQQLRDHAPVDRLEAIDALLARDPSNAWALRERALVLLQLQRHDEALTEALKARSLDPNTPSSAGIVGDVLSARGNWAGAREEYRNALRLQIGADHCYQSLLSACRDEDQRREAIHFIEEEIKRQPLSDDAPLPYQSAARTILPAEDLAARLDSLRRKHPDHWQTWAALAVHLSEMGKQAEAVAVLEEAVDRFPVLPRLWCELGIARFHRGSFPGAIEALEKARALNPGWTRPYIRLGLAYEAHLRLDDAERILRLGIAADPTEPTLRGQLADVLWKLGKHKPAVDEMEHALFLSPAITWAWSRLHDWHRDLGRADGALGTVDRLLAARPGDAEVWLRKARILLSLGQREDALRACDEANRCDSRLIGAHDLRAEILVELGRYGEARVACAPPALASVRPYELDGRAAWVEAARGDRDAAIAAMRTVTERNPDYYWGWEQLCTWFGDSDRHEDALRAAERMIWINPTGSVPHAYRAIAELGLNRRTAAKDSLRQSLHFEPDYLWAAQRLLGLLIEDAELVEAERLFGAIRAHMPGPTALLAELRLHIAANRREEIARCLRELAQVPAHHEEELSTAINLLFEHHLESLVEATTRPLLDRPGTNPLIGTAWVRSWKEHRHWIRIHRINRKSVPPALADKAWTELVEHLGDTHRVRSLRLLRWIYRSRLQERTTRWGSMGYALVCCRRHRTTTRWLADYRGRPDAQPWMLHNLALANLSLGRWRQLTEVLDHTLALPADHVRRPVVAMRAFTAAREGDYALARGMLEATGIDGLKATPACCRAATEALLALADRNATDPVSVQDIFDAHEKRSSPFAAEPYTRPIRREFARLAAQLDGRWFYWLRQRLRLRLESARRPTSTSRHGSGSTPVWLIGILLLMALRALLSLAQK